MLQNMPKLCRYVPAVLILLIVAIGSGNPIWAGSAAVNDADESSPAAPIQAKAFNKEVELLYRYVEEGNIQAVLEQVRKVSGLFESSSFQGLAGVEGIHVLAESIIEMKEATAHASQDPQHWMLTAGKLRLAADSLTHMKDALWLQYFKVVREDLDKMGELAGKQDKQGMASAFESLQGHYELIRPSVIIQRKPDEVNMVESWLSYAGGLVSSGDTEGVQRIVPQGEELVNTLFGKKRDEPALAPLGEVKEPWTWQVIIGAVILAALTFAGYRKYRGQLNSTKPLFPPKA